MQRFGVFAAQIKFHGVVEPVFGQVEFFGDDLRRLVDGLLGGEYGVDIARGASGVVGKRNRCAILQVDFTLNATRLQYRRQTDECAQDLLSV